jgi:hypothetical protein
MTLWDTIKSWVDQNSKQYVYVQIPQAQSDVQYDETPLRANVDYFRLWLTDMYLAKSRQWFVNLHPVVQSTVRLRLMGDDDVSLSFVTNAPESALTRGVFQNYAMTELLPFRGGTVSLAASLLAFQGTNYANASISVLENFVPLVRAPLGQYLDVAKAVTNSLQGLLGAGNGSVHLGLFQTYASDGVANALRPGYVAVILATHDEVDTSKLRVKESRLYLGDQLFSGYDFMLFNVEKRAERDNWRLSYITEPMEQAVEQHLLGKTKEAEALMNTALLAVYRSADLTASDKRRVIQTIKEEIGAYAAGGQGAAKAGGYDLGELVQTRSMPVSEAAAYGELTLDEVFR